MNKKDFLSRFGPWAIVTGATSGIGREFADQLADLGLNLVSVSRRQDALDGVAASLSKRTGIQTRTVALDLSEPGFLAMLKQAVEDINVGLFVSNAGADHMGRRVLTRSMSAGMWGMLMNKAAPDSLKVKPRA